MDATVTSLLCTSSLLLKGEGKQFWVAEFEGQNIAAVYNLLEGKQKLTQTLAKNLRVVGVLLHIGKSRTPLLRSKDLDRAAGITTRVLRCEAPIKVAGRQRLQKARNALCKKLAREPLSGKKVKKHTLKACKTKAKRKVNNPRSARVSKDTTTSTGRRHKKQREGTLQWHFSRPSLPQGGLWEKPVTSQVTDDHVLEVSDDSPRCAEDDLKFDGNSRVELSTDPISEFSVDPEQPVVDMPPSSIGTVPILSGSIGSRTRKPKPDGIDALDAGSVVPEQFGEVGLSANSSAQAAAKLQLHHSEEQSGNRGQRMQHASLHHVSAGRSEDKGDCVNAAGDLEKEHSAPDPSTLWRRIS